MEQSNEWGANLGGEFSATVMHAIWGLKAVRSYFRLLLQVSLFIFCTWAAFLIAISLV